VQKTEPNGKKHLETSQNKLHDLDIQKVLKILEETKNLLLEVEAKLEERERKDCGIHMGENKNEE